MCFNLNNSFSAKLSVVSALSGEMREGQQNVSVNMHEQMGMLETVQCGISALIRLIYCLGVQKD